MKRKWILILLILSTYVSMLNASNKMKQNNIPTINKLLENYTSLDLLENSIKEYKNDINKPLKDGFTPLHTALLFHPLEVIQLLVENGADSKIVTDEGDTIYHTCVKYCINKDRRKILKYLIQINPNDINKKNNIGITPFFSFLKNNQIDDKFLELLLANGANKIVNEGFKGQLPLELSNNYQRINLLLKYGANPNLKHIDSEILIQNTPTNLRNTIRISTNKLTTFQFIKNQKSKSKSNCPKLVSKILKKGIENGYPYIIYESQCFARNSYVKVIEGKKLYIIRKSILQILSKNTEQQALHYFENVFLCTLSDIPCINKNK